MRCEKGKGPKTYRWHHLHHAHVLAASGSQLHPHNLGERGDAGLGGAVGRVEGQREVRQGGAGEEEGRLGAGLGQGEEVRGKRLGDQVRCDQIGRDLADHFRGVGGLEDRVVVLDPGVDEDGIEVGEIGEDALDVALQVG